MINKLTKWLFKRTRPKMIEGLSASYSPRYYFEANGYVWLRLDENEGIERCKIVDIAI